MTGELKLYRNHMGWRGFPVVSHEHHRPLVIEMNAEFSCYFRAQNVVLRAGVYEGSEGQRTAGTMDGQGDKRQVPVFVTPDDLVVPEDHPERWDPPPMKYASDDGTPCISGRATPRFCAACRALSSDRLCATTRYVPGSSASHWPRYFLSSIFGMPLMLPSSVLGQVCLSVGVLHQCYGSAFASFSLEAFSAGAAAGVGEEAGEAAGEGAAEGDGAGAGADGET